MDGKVAKPGPPRVGDTVALARTAKGGIKHGLRCGEMVQVQTIWHQAMDAPPNPNPNPNPNWMLPAGDPTTRVSLGGSVLGVWGCQAEHPEANLPYETSYRLVANDSEGTTYEWFKASKLRRTPEPDRNPNPHGVQGLGARPPPVRPEGVAPGFQP